MGNDHALQVKLLIEISTHPELNRLALKRRLDTAYIVWLILRHNVTVANHSSHYSISNVRNVCMNFNLNYTKRHWQRIIKSGEGIFWGKDDKNIYIRSFKRVYEILADDTAKNIPNPRFVNIEIYKNSTLRRAELYMSWFISRDGITIARDTLQDLFGLSHHQQRSLESALGARLIIKSNYCHINADKYRNNPKYVPNHAYTFKQEKFTDDIVYYDDVIAYQLPNTYIPSKEYNAGYPAANFAPRRAVNVCRTLYRQTNSLYTTKRYYWYLDDISEIDQTSSYIRTYYQGRKQINRIGHYL